MSNRERYQVYALPRGDFDGTILSEDDLAERKEAIYDSRLNRVLPPDIVKKISKAAIPPARPAVFKRKHENAEHRQRFHNGYEGPFGLYRRSFEDGHEKDAHIDGEVSDIVYRDEAGTERVPVNISEDGDTYLDRRGTSFGSDGSMITPFFSLAALFLDADGNVRDKKTRLPVQGFEMPFVPDISALESPTYSEGSSSGSSGGSLRWGSGF